MIKDIYLKKGSGVPSSLKYAEPAVDMLNKVLYIGMTEGEDGGSDLIKIIDEDRVNELISKGVHGSIEECILRDECLHYYGDETIRPTNNSYFSFELIDGEATVSLAEGASTSLRILIIPYKCEIDGVEYEVKRTGNYSFAYMSLLEKVVLPECLTIIGEGSFNQCKSLQNVELPKSLKEIRQWAFGYCAFLNVVIPDGVNTLGNRAFSKCPNLKNITIPISVTDIGAGIFEDCTSLVTVFLHNSILYTGANDARDFFRYCTKLKDVYLGPMEVLGAYMFEGCSSLKYIEIEEGTEEIDSGVFKDCTTLERISIPDSVTFINATAFTNCPLLNIVCSQGSYAENFAIENDIPYEYHTMSSKIVRDSENLIKMINNFHYYGNKDIEVKSSEFFILDEVLNINDGAISNGLLVIPIELGEFSSISCLNSGQVEKIIIPRGCFFMSDENLVSNFSNIKIIVRIHDDGSVSSYNIEEQSMN